MIHSRHRTSLLFALAFLLPAVGASSRPKAPPRSSPRSELVELRVHDVVPLGEEGHVVMLVAMDGETLLPLAIDEYSAIAIAFRLAHLSSPHPLPADVLEQITAQLGGKVVGVTLDDPTGEDQECEVEIQQGREAHRVRARPADGISLALSSGTRIHATRRIMANAGIKRSDGEAPSRLERDGARSRRLPRPRFEL